MDALERFKVELLMGDNLNFEVPEYESAPEFGGSAPGR